MKRILIYIRVKLYNGQYVECPVSLKGQLNDFPYDLRLCNIHPEDYNKMKKITFPRKLFTTYFGEK